MTTPWYGLIRDCTEVNPEWIVTLYYTDKSLQLLLCCTTNMRSIQWDVMILDDLTDRKTDSESPAWECCDTAVMSCSCVQSTHYHVQVHDNMSDFGLWSSTQVTLWALVYLNGKVYIMPPVLSLCNETQQGVLRRKSAVESYHESLNAQRPRYQCYQLNL